MFGLTTLKDSVSRLASACYSLADTLDQLNDGLRVQCRLTGPAAADDGQAGAEGEPAALPGLRGKGKRATA